MYYNGGVVSDRTKPPYQFTKEDCRAGLMAVEVDLTKLRNKVKKVEIDVEFTRR